MVHVGKFAIRLTNRLADAAVFTAAFVLGSITRYYFKFSGQPLFEIFDRDTLLLVYLVFMGLNHFSFSFNAVYPTSRLRSFDKAAWMYFKSVFLALIWLVLLAFFIRDLQLSRLLVVSATGYSFVLLMAKEAAFRWLLKRARSSGRNRRRILLIGGNSGWMRGILSKIQDDPVMGLQVIGVIPSSPDPGGAPEGVDCLGTLQDFEKVIEQHVVDCAIFPWQSDRERGRLDDCIWQCEQRGIEVWLALEPSQLATRSFDVEHLDNLSFLTLRTGPSNPVAITLKYTFDRIVSGLVLIALLPLLALVALLVKCTSPGPILFKQPRAGLNGRTFMFYKFRSMIRDAEARKESLQSLNEMQGPVFKIKNDPRITPIGRLLRKTSLDELPQLMNVLAGDMSLVGPRPLPVQEAANIRGANRRRLSMKPGITCIWQVTGRNKIRDFNDWAQLDLQYIDNWSLKLDLELLVKTIPAVLKGTGV